MVECIITLVQDKAMRPEPAHHHDCDTCRFLGTVGPLPGEKPVNAVDLYVHRRLNGDFTLIRRYSSELADYAAWPALAGTPETAIPARYLEAFRMFSKTHSV